MKNIISILVLTVVLVSCGTSNNVVNDGLFQKRKYTSGWFVKKKKGVEKKSIVEEKLAFEEVNNVEKTDNIKHSISTNVKHNESKINNVKDSKEITPKVTETKKRNNVFSKKTTNKASKVHRNLEEDQSHEKTNTTLKKFDPSRESNAVKSQNNTRSSSDISLIILVILAIIVPPLAVFLVQGASKLFVIDLLLFLIGVSSVWFFNLGGLLALAAVVIAVLVVLGYM